MILPLISAFMHGISSIYLHDLRGKANHLVVLQYNYIIQIFMVGVLENTFSQKCCLKGISFSFMINVVFLVLFAYLSQNTLIKAIYIKKASYIMPFAYGNVVISLLLDIIVFGE